MFELRGAPLFLLVCLSVTVNGSWKTCPLPDGVAAVGKPLQPGAIATLACQDLTKNGLIAALTEHDSLLVHGPVTPQDLRPLHVVPLHEDVFLVEAATPGRKRRRRSFFDGQHFDLSPPVHDTFVVSSFAINPKLLNNDSHTERYSVFAKLTEGVLQEYYNQQAGHPDEKAKRSEANSQIYTENLFNKIVSGVGKLREDDAPETKEIRAKSLDEIMKEFQSESLEGGAVELPSDSDLKILEASAMGVRLINESHYLLTNPDILQKVIQSKDLFQKMTPRVMLIPTLNLEESSDNYSFPIFRTFVLFTPNSAIEVAGNAGVFGIEAFRGASVLLSELNSQVPVPAR